MKVTDSLKRSSLYKFRVFVERVLNIVIGPFLFQYQRKDNLFNWFYQALKYQHIDNPASSPKYNYYEFGVASGGSLKIYILALKKFCRDYHLNIGKFHIFAFDSFQGLPEAEEADKRNDWGKGMMSHPKSQVEGVVKDTGFPQAQFHAIEGFYDKSLTLELKKELQKYPPAIINMDADYYSSTMTVFKWIGTMLPSGSYFRFDDMWSFYGHPDKGVVKAISEFNAMDFGTLTPFPVFGLDSYCYVFARKEFEYV